MRFFLVSLFLIGSAASAADLLSCTAADYEAHYSVRVFEIPGGLQYEAAQTPRFAHSNVKSYSSSGPIEGGNRFFQNGGTVSIYPSYRNIFFEDQPHQIQIQFSYAECTFAPVQGE